MISRIFKIWLDYLYATHRIKYILTREKLAGFSKVLVCLENETTQLTIDAEQRLQLSHSLLTETGFQTADALTKYLHQAELELYVAAPTVWDATATSSSTRLIRQLIPVLVYPVTEYLLSNGSAPSTPLVLLENCLAYFSFPKERLEVILDLENSTQVLEELFKLPSFLPTAKLQAEVAQQLTAARKSPTTQVNDEFSLLVLPKFQHTDRLRQEIRRFYALESTNRFFLRAQSPTSLILQKDRLLLKSSVSTVSGLLTLSAPDPAQLQAMKLACQSPLSAMVGPAGSGKTSTLRTIAGLQLSRRAERLVRRKADISNLTVYICASAPSIKQFTDARNTVYLDTLLPIALDLTNRSVARQQITDRITQLQRSEYSVDLEASLRSRLVEYYTLTDDRPDIEKHTQQITEATTTLTKFQNAQQSLEIEVKSLEERHRQLMLQIPLAYQNELLLDSLNRTAETLETKLKEASFRHTHTLLPQIVNFYLKRVHTADLEKLQSFLQKTEASALSRTPSQIVADSADRLRSLLRTFRDARLVAFTLDRKNDTLFEIQARIRHEEQRLSEAEALILVQQAQSDVFSAQSLEHLETHHELFQLSDKLLFTTAVQAREHVISALELLREALHENADLETLQYFEQSFLKHAKWISLCFPVFVCTASAFSEIFRVVLPDCFDLALIDDAESLRLHEVFAILYRSRRAVIAGAPNLPLPTLQFSRNMIKEAKKLVPNTSEDLQLFSRFFPASTSLLAHLRQLELPTSDLQIVRRTHPEITAFLARQNHALPTVVFEEDAVFRDLSEYLSGRLLYLDADDESRSLLEIAVEAVAFFREASVDLSDVLFLFLSRRDCSHFLQALQQRAPETDWQTLRLGTYAERFGEHAPIVYFSADLQQSATSLTLAEKEAYLFDPAVFSAYVSLAQSYFIFSASLKQHSQASRSLEYVIATLREDGFQLRLFDD